MQEYLVVRSIGELVTGKAGAMKEYIVHAMARLRGSAEQFQPITRIVEARDVVTAETTFRAQWETFGGFSMQEAVRHYK